MKKRIVCALLALIMLVSLVPATALTASAASLKTSEAAITVLKQLEGYSTTCNANGYTGYGTVCTEKGTHGTHTTTEKKADVALREALADLDDAINSFASKNGLSLTQNKHDALVLFSFENGTAWTTGTGDFKAAVTSGKKGTEFLNAICWWDNNIADDNRRMVEANMYLNGVYSSTKPSQFIRVKLDTNAGFVEVPTYDADGNFVLDDDGEIVTEMTKVEAYLAEAEYQYFDITKTKTISIVPTNTNHTFMGWYTDDLVGERVTTLTAANHNDTLYAHWQATIDEPGTINVYYSMYSKDLASTTIYTAPGGKETKASLAKYITIVSEYLDDQGTRWGYVIETNNIYVFGDVGEEDYGYTVGNGIGWVKISTAKSGSTSDTSADIDVTVTVTNSYVNRRSEASIYSTKNGTYNQGAQLRIINTASKDGFLWGQVAESATSNESVGWVALMYTNFESVRNEGTNVNNGTVIATATITYSGYVNVRSDAGTDNQIVGALPKGTQVDLYETKYVNGIQWGRCKTGWLCLAYADVTTIVKDTSYTTDSGYLSYVFTGTLIDATSCEIFKSPSESAERVRTREYLDPNVTITNLTAAEGYTWGKFEKGWVKVSDSKGAAVDVKLDVTQYTVSADALTVRTAADTSSARVDTLSKGVEFNVNQSKQVIVVGETVWGYADKVGEDNKTYGGWVNLASKYVSRSTMPTVSTDTNTPTGQTATIIGADSVRVRGDSTLSGKVIGSIARGTTVNILGERNGWYMIDYEVDDDPETDSWVYSQYVEVKEGTVGSGSTGTGSTGETGVGIISNTYSGVNVRSNPGTGSALVGKILPGTQVNILEVTTYGSSKWGRVEQGWICMDYVTIVSDLPDEVLAALNGTTTGSTGTTSGSSSTAEVAIYTGTVTAAEGVKVYKTTSQNSDVVRELAKGANVTMHEIVTVTEKVTTSTTESNSGATTTTKEVTSYWARVNDGYIYSPGDNLSLDTLDEATYTLTESNTLNVRNNAGTDGTTVKFKLAKGDQVAVTKLQIVNGKVWGYVECDDGEGWASLAYMTKGAVSVADQTVTETTPAETTPTLGSTGNTGTGGYVTNTSGYKYTGKVINTNSLNVRATASTNASITTTLKNGASLVIYETTISEYMAWGRCDAGWVYLYYVDMTPVNGAVDARVVYNDNTIAYTDVNCSEVAGTYSKMAVIDIYEIVGNMVRTDLGWVSTDNLL